MQFMAYLVSPECVSCAVEDGIDPDSHEVWNTILEGSHG